MVSTGNDARWKYKHTSPGGTAGLAGTPQKVQLWNRKDDFCKNRGAATVCGALRRPLKWRRVAHEAGVSEPGRETERTWPPPAGLRASRGAGGFFIVHARGRPAKAGTLGRNRSWRTDDRRMTGFLDCSLFYSLKPKHLRPQCFP
uniref:Uncharacterized protein n=1 Tax=Rousettus aegyptiacus TaxID=9407 RepID=A0A7J8DIJ4_ROUAE|nr:hypothetical protein HJG63_008706 [Rousettus aegyptiacus]